MYTDQPFAQMPALPPTPPHDEPAMPHHPSTSGIPQSSKPISPLGAGLELLAAERDGLAHLHSVYSSCPVAQKGFSSAVEVLVSTTQRHGRVVVSGVGKSGLIGRKMIATMNSLGIRAGWLHPTEALHGDLGMMGPNDALLLITFSGSTVELLSLMGHLPSTLPVILMSAALPDTGKEVSDLPLFSARVNTFHENNILLPTPVPIAEKVLFGVSAPTVSTTVTLALGDALAMAAARQLYESRDGVGEIFKKYHPGGAIGKANATGGGQPASPPQIPSDEPAILDGTVSLGGSTIGDETDNESDASGEGDSTSGITDIGDEGRRDHDGVDKIMFEVQEGSIGMVA